MYTEAMPNQQPSENLAVFLRRWRGQRGVTEVARAVGLSTHSIWSKMEAGQEPSIETLLLLSEHTGKPVEELAAMAGIPVQRSLSDPDRARRIAAMEAAVPKMAVLIDLLPELDPSEIDVLLTVAEGFLRRRHEGQG